VADLANFVAHAVAKNSKLLIIKEYEELKGGTDGIIEKKLQVA